MSFDAVAPHYRWLEVVLAGPLLQRCRTRFSPALDDARRVLVLGPGRGRFVIDLLARNPVAHVTLVDASASMLEYLSRDLARARVSPDRIELVHADLRHYWPPAARFDAIASHFVLDCFTADELSGVVARVATAAAERARWVIADFAVPERGWRRWRARAIHAAMYGAFRAATGLSARRLTPPDPFLERAGFRLRARAHESCRLLHTDLWERGGSRAASAPPVP